jgi:hypothetical protein
VGRNIEADVNRFGGLARRSRLRELGASARSVSTAIDLGVLQVPRRGWVCTARAPAEAVRAVELGGILGGASALRSYGIWVDGTDLIVATAPSASRLPPLRMNERRTWLSERFAGSPARPWRVSVGDALLQHAKVVDRPSLIASVDSALYTHRLTTSEFGRVLAALPQHLRAIRRQVDGRSMSGTESKLRLACVAAGLRVELQASIANVGFVDLLIDGWLIVEVDSHEFHDTPVHQHNDRVRDGNAVLGDYGHLRFDYQLVQFELGWCVEVILARLKSGR